MRDPGRRGLAWALWGSAMAMLVAGVALSAVGGGPLDEVVSACLVVPVSATVGVLIFARVPGNPIGWVLLGVGVIGGLAALANGYADYSLPSGPGSETLGELGVWVGSWLWAPLTLAPLTFALLLFPDGRMPSRRWWVVAGLAGVGIVAFGALVGLSPDAGEARWGLEGNPYGLHDADALLAVLGVLGALALPAIIGSVAALIVRFRRSTGRQRQQIKWLAYGGASAAVISVVAGTLLDERSGAPILVGGAQALIPAAIGVAILRHRLYEIDRVINRTVVYAAVTVLLACCYAGLVLLLRTAFEPLTEDNGLAVALSTLAVAALFQPLRRRVQRLVDRRFYRNRYDAARTLEGFSARLQSQTDLEALRADLAGVVREAMQPAHVSLWLRGPASVTVPVTISGRRPDTTEGR